MGYVRMCDLSSPLPQLPNQISLILLWVLIKNWITPLWAQNLGSRQLGQLIHVFIHIQSNVLGACPFSSQFKPFHNEN